MGKSLSVLLILDMLIAYIIAMLYSVVAIMQCLLCGINPCRHSPLLQRYKIRKVKVFNVAMLRTQTALYCTISKYTNFVILHCCLVNKLYYASPTNG
jgi:hypothetical protein